MRGSRTVIVQLTDAIREGVGVAIQERQLVRVCVCEKYVHM